MRYFLTLMILTCLSLNSSAKNSYQSHAGILKVVRDYVEQTLTRADPDLEVTLGKLDPRLRLSVCDGQIEAFSPQGSRRIGNTTVGVRCQNQRPWSLFVPVRIKVMRQIVILTNHLSRGATLTTNDLSLRRLDISSRSGDYFQDPRELIGRVLTRSVRAGRQLSRQDIAAATVIRRGQLVTLLAETNGFTVRMKGKAMTDGAKGDLIRVKNVNSSRIIEGIVRGPGIIHVKI